MTVPRTFIAPVCPPIVNTACKAFSTCNEDDTSLMNGVQVAGLWAESETVRGNVDTLAAKAFIAETVDLNRPQRSESQSNYAASNSSVAPGLNTNPAAVCRQCGHPNNSSNPTSANNQQQASTSQSTSNQTTGAGESSASVGGSGGGDGNGDDPRRPQPPADDAGMDDPDENDEEDESEEEQGVGPTTRTPITVEQGNRDKMNGDISGLSVQQTDGFHPVHPQDDGSGQQACISPAQVNHVTEIEPRCRGEAPSSDKMNSTEKANPSCPAQSQDAVEEANTSRVTKEDPIAHPTQITGRREVQNPQNEREEAASDNRNEEIGYGGAGVADGLTTLRGSQSEDQSTIHPITHPWSYSEQRALISSRKLPGYVLPPVARFHEEMGVDVVGSSKQILLEDPQHPEVDVQRSRGVTKFVNDDRTNEAPSAPASRETNRSQCEPEPVTSALRYEPGQQSIANPMDARVTHKELVTGATQSLVDLQPGSSTAHHNNGGHSATKPTDDRRTHVRPALATAKVTEGETQHQGDPHPGNSMLHHDDHGEDSATKPTYDRGTHVKPAIATAKVTQGETQPRGDPYPGNSMLHHDDHGGPSTTKRKDDRKTQGILPTTASVETLAATRFQEEQPGSSVMHHETGERSSAVPKDDRMTLQEPVTTTSEAAQAAIHSQGDLQPASSAQHLDHEEQTTTKPIDNEIPHQERVTSAGEATLAAPRFQGAQQLSSSEIHHDHEEPSTIKPKDVGTTHQEPATAAARSPDDQSQSTTSVMHHGLEDPSNARPDQESVGNQGQHTSRENVPVHHSLRPEELDRPGTNDEEQDLPDHFSSLNVAEEPVRDIIPPSQTASSASPRNPLPQQANGGPGPPGSVTPPSAALSNMGQEQNEGGAMGAHTTQSPTTQRPTKHCDRCSEDIVTSSGEILVDRDLYICGLCVSSEPVEVSVHADRERLDRVFFDPPERPDGDGMHQVAFQMNRLNERTLMRCYRCPTEVWTMEALYCPDCSRYFCCPACFWQHQCFGRVFEEDDGAA